MEEHGTATCTSLFTFVPACRSALSRPAVAITYGTYLLLCVGLAWLMVLSPWLGLAGACVINLIVLCCVHPRVLLVLYILVAGPSIAFSFASSGVLSRLYIGDVLFALTVLVCGVRFLPTWRKLGRTAFPVSLMIPLSIMIIIGLSSIVYARLYPDPNVQYAFPHSDVSLTATNLAEMAILVGLPLFLIVLVGALRTQRDVHWVVGGLVAIGIVYALGTIFAAPLGLSSQERILGITRPQVLGSVSSGLGTLILLFFSIALGRALFARVLQVRVWWSLASCLFALGVIMSFGRESWIELFVATLIMVVVRSRSWNALLLLFAPLLLLLVPGVFSFFDPTQIYGADRFKIWLDAIAIWQRSPTMGVGAGNYQFFDVVYGVDVVGVAHSQYLQVLAEMGIQGLLCLLWILAVLGRLIVKSYRSATTEPGRALSLAGIGYFAVLLVAGLFTSPLYPSAAGGGGTASLVETSYRWLLFGLVLSIPNWEPRVRRAVARGAPDIEAEPAQQRRAAIRAGE